jgi:hypothetical protein
VKVLRRRREKAPRAPAYRRASKRMACRCPKNGESGAYFFLEFFRSSNLHNGIVGRSSVKRRKNELDLSMISLSPIIPTNQQKREKNPHKTLHVHSTPRSGAGRPTLAAAPGWEQHPYPPPTSDTFVERSLDVLHAVRRSRCRPHQSSSSTRKINGAGSKYARLLPLSVRDDTQPRGGRTSAAPRVKATASIRNRAARAPAPGVSPDDVLTTASRLKRVHTHLLGQHKIAASLPSPHDARQQQELEHQPEPRHLRRTGKRRLCKRMERRGSARGDVYVRGVRCGAG